MLGSLFDRLKTDRTLVDVYRDSIGDPLFGWVAKYSDQFLHLTKYNDFGEYDGGSIIFVEDISRIRWDGIERKSIEKLVELKSEPGAMIPDLDLHDIKSVLTAVQEDLGYVSLYAEHKGPDSYFIGQIQDIYNDFVYLKEFGSKNSLDRSSLLLKLDDISRVDFDGKYEKDLLRLHSIKDNKVTSLFRE
jgi:hypothetical protein